ncbi:alpha-ketoacid dehydrogenase subunit alpha/beta [Echinicola salinicaeni]|uniref:alpha-ketoacid dehydrogenase subunit alpha/beta n=1 Tax=Echinicola salinicaeni TaxID=2762757 RepID=UPI001E3982EC|nr:dehydrogenase E1 component subunit alpha/beta [Echinicola salinicaeni]
MNNPDSLMFFDRKHLSEEALITFYQALLVPRKIEEKMLVLLRQGKISKWFSGWGQEAISTAAVMAMESDEFLLPMHRNLGVFTGRGIPLDRLFAQFQGKSNGYTKGRDRSFHFGSLEHHIVGMISHLGPQMALADGIALSHKLKKENKATLVFTGDGASSEGDFHEALNIAAVWQLPVIFLIENNGYGLSTPSHEQFRCEQFIDKGPGYGMEAVKVDGNNILALYHCLNEIANDIRENPRPFIVEACTYRMRGHEEASGTKYVPKDYFEEGAKKDPIKNFEKFLITEGILDEKLKKSINQEIQDKIDKGLDKAFSSSAPKANSIDELADVYAPHAAQVAQATSSKKSEKRLVDAIHDSLELSMQRQPELILMGQDIATYGGVFKVTDGFLEKFGPERVRNTPLCESAIIGTALGLSIAGYKSVVEMQFADFVSCGFNQIVNNLAKLHYRWGQHADVVIRLPTGAGVGAGPFHSQSNEAWFFHTPGLKIIYPSSPYQAKGLLAAAIEDPNPCLFFEHKGLYRSISEEIPDDYYHLAIGKAHLVREGEQLSIITYGAGVHWAKEALQETGIDADILDLCTLLPWDKKAVAETVRKTNKVIILHEDCLTGGIGAEIAAWISEHCFELLDAPVMREASLDTPVPFAASLEENFLPQDRFRKKLKQLLEY